jgi:Uma2 family endonuclease
MKIGELTVTRPATDVPGPPQGQWTYEDVRALPEDGNRYEVLNGVLYVSPGPTPNHQRRLFRLSVWFDRYVRARSLGEWFIAPTDLVMPGATPVEPDAFFVAAANTSVEELETHLEGVPDLVVEVASPSTASYDRRQKQDAYARAGVPEYWIVDPSALAIEVLVRDAVEASYRSLGVFSGGRRLTSTVFGDLPHSVEELFA